MNPLIRISPMFVNPPFVVAIQYTQLVAEEECCGVAAAGGGASS